MNNRLVLSRIALCLIVALPLTARAQEIPSPPPAAVLSPEKANSFDPAAATQAWLNTVPAEKRERSDAYFEGGCWLILWNFLLAAAILLCLLATRISARLRDFVERFSRFKAMQIALYAVVFVVLTYTLGFPLTVYQQFFREHAYGMATQNFGQWFLEQVKAIILMLVGVSIGLPILYAVFRRTPRTWWIWGSIVAVCFSTFLNFISPIFIEPIFNTYKPLTDRSISQPILAMARANEIPVTQVFEVDASRQTNRISANVAGFLGTTRIALNDNLLRQCSLPEIREVMAHEMGHYVLNHIQKLIFEFAVLIFLCFAVARAAFDSAVRRWGEAWGVRNVGDIAGLPLISLIFAAVVFLVTPITNTISRVTEREADAFSINTSREPDSMATIALKLGAYRKLNPGPIEEFIFFDHPSGRARIRMAMDWKAAQLPCGDVDTRNAERE